MDVDGKFEDALRALLVNLFGDFGSVPALNLLDEAKSKGPGATPDFVASTGIPASLLSVVDNLHPDAWDNTMYDAICNGNGDLRCVKLLYDKGYNLHTSNRPKDHPACIASRLKSLKVLQFVVEQSGPPEGAQLYCAHAVRGGVEMLRYVRELGGVLDESTPRVAAREGDLEALRFAHACGAPWDSATIAAAVTAGSLPCLEYAHKHGCPTDPRPDELAHAPDCANGLAVLQYMCEHMDTTWTAEVLEHTARALVWSAREDLISVKDWQLVLFLGRKLGPAAPGALTKAVAIRKERAAALAWVFRKAGQEVLEEERRLLLGKVEVDGVKGKTTHEDARRLAVWEVMARVPKELRERIALEAHLIIR
jgi:hypothetical protein